MTGGNHEPFYQQKYIANSLALLLEHVRVILPPTGGSFGGKQDPWPFIATTLMTQAVHRPVRLIYSRTESFDATPKRHPYVVHNKIGATAEGRLTGIRVCIDANTGGYDAGGQHIPSYTVTASGGPYHWQAVDASARTVYTNGPKAGQYRRLRHRSSGVRRRVRAGGRGPEKGDRSDRVSAEKHAAHWRSILPRLPRRRDHRLHTGARSHPPALQSLPFRRGSLQQGHLFAYFVVYQSTSLPIYHSSRCRPGGHVVSLRQIRHAADRGARRAGAADGRFIVYCTAADYGQGMNTVVSQMAAEALGVPRSSIEVINADTARVPTAPSRAHRGLPTLSAGR